MHKKTLLLAGLVATAITAAGGAYAASGSASADQAEMQAALAAKVSLSQAVKAAEASSGGKAMEVVFTDENAKPGYEVTTVTSDGAEQNLFVDATTGKAAKATAAERRTSRTTTAPWTTARKAKTSSLRSRRSRAASAARESQLEAQSRIPVDQPDLGTMQFGDGLDETEAEPAARRRAALVQPIEAPEDHVAFCFGDAGSIVVDGRGQEPGLRPPDAFRSRYPSGVWRMAFSMRLANICVSNSRSPDTSADSRARLDVERERVTEILGHLRRRSRAASQARRRGSPARTSPGANRPRSAKCATAPRISRLSGPPLRSPRGVRRRSRFPDCCLSRASSTIIRNRLSGLFRSCAMSALTWRMLSTVASSRASAALMLRDSMSMSSPRPMSGMRASSLPSETASIVSLTASNLRCTRYPSHAPPPTASKATRTVAQREA